MYSEDLNSNDTPAYKAEILAISAASCEERFVRLTMRLNSNSFEVTDILIPFDQARERLQKELAEVLERLSRGEENERLYSEAMKVIEAADLSSTDVVAETNEAVSVFGEWGQTAMYAALFADDSDTRLLAMNCIIADHENYRDYLPYFRELDQHVDEVVRRLVPELLKLFE
jgi:hypothetical protein